MRFRMNRVLVDVENAPAWQDDRASHQVDMAVEIEVDADEEFYNYLPVVEND